MSTPDPLPPCAPPQRWWNMTKDQWIAAAIAPLILSAIQGTWLALLWLIGVAMSISL